MSKHPIPPSARSQRIGGTPLRLPFDTNSNKGGWAEWIFRHRIGLLITVVIYLCLAILFVSYRIVILPKPVASIEIEFEPERIEQLKEMIEQQQIEKMEQMDMGRMQNKVSSENSKFNETLRDSKNSDASEIYKDAERMQEELRKGQEDYDRSIQEIEQLSKPKDTEPKSNIKSQEGKENQDAFVSGNVAASFILAGRTAVYIDIPAYKCQGGGRVVVNISVNRNGRVVAASVDRATSTSDKCILDEAVNSAKACRFSTSSTALDPQRGTITYTFVAQ